MEVLYLPFGRVCFSFGLTLITLIETLTFFFFCTGFSFTSEDAWGVALPNAPCIVRLFRSLTLKTDTPTIPSPKDSRASLKLVSKRVADLQHLVGT